MAADVPPDVEAVLTQLFQEARSAFADSDTETGVAALTSASSVVNNKLPDGPLRDRLLHGCERAQAVATAADDDAEVAAEYVASMERRLADATAE